MKRVMYPFGVFVGLLFLSFQFGGDPLFYIPDGWPNPRYDFAQNPLTVEKVKLGRTLFYDPILSINNTISCASCHSQYTAFTHVDHALSHGIHDRMGTRNAPVLINLAWQNAFMWDGAIHHLDMQSLAPISHPDEMGETIEHVVFKLQQSDVYPELFYEAFVDSLVTGEHTLKAIAQFMLTLVSTNSKYDQMLRGETTFSTQEANGYQLFKKHCASCHQEPLFTDGTFRNNGLAIDEKLQDMGRMKITGLVEDAMAFKVPTLRNIEFSYPYMHDGRFKKLSEVIAHYTTGTRPGNSPAFMEPIQLSSNERVDLLTFLLTLTDKTFLFNPQFSYPREILLTQKIE